MATKTPQQEYDEAERSLIGEAVADTEQEIFDDAFDAAPEEKDGDRSLEEIDGDDIPDDDVADDDETELAADGAEGDDIEPEPEPKPTADRQQRGIPSARLKEEADARRAAEAEANAMRAEMAALRAEMQANRQPRQQPVQEAPPKPDLFADPEGWAASQRQAIREEIETTNFNRSMAEAHQEHGDRFGTAFKALQQAGDPVAINQIRQSYNPGKALMQWHDRQALMAEVRDPAAYRERVRQELLADPEVRQQLVGELRGQAGTRVRLPPSLASARGGGSHQSKDGALARRPQTSKSVESDIFDSAFE